MKLSIVTTLYQSAPYIYEFYERIKSIAEKTVGDDFEIIFVNDGSPDNSLEIVIELTKQDSKVSVLDLSRNFGHHKAMMTGLGNAIGERIFLIDSDLEEEPEWLLPFYNQMNDDKSDVVYGLQLKRKGGWFEKFSGWMFYKLFRCLTSVSQPDNILTVRLMTRRYVNALLNHTERELNIGGLWLITGYLQTKRFVHKHSTSPTTYSIARKLNHFINAITSFSSQPLIFVFYLGLIVSFTAGIFILYHIFNYFFGATPPSGYTSIIASIWLFSGLIIFVIGVQGIYISKIFTEVKQRPYTIIREIYKKDLNK